MRSYAEAVENNRNDGKRLFHILQSVAGDERMNERTKLYGKLKSITKNVNTFFIGKSMRVCFVL